MAQQTFGMFYPGSQAERITQQEIDWLEDAGFSWLMVQNRLSSEQRQMIHEAGFSLYVLVPEYFAIPQKLSSPSYGYYERAETLLQHYHNDTAVQGLGLLAYSNWQEPQVPARLEQLAASFSDDHTLFTLDARPFSGPSLRPFDGVLLLTRSSERLVSQLEGEPAASGILYYPMRIRADIRDLQNVLELWSDHSETPVFFERSWFVQNMEVSGRIGLDRLTAFHARTSEGRLANPSPDDDLRDLDFSIVLLFILWAAYTTYYRVNPIYRKSVRRFFMNYDFFVNDVLMRRIRLPGDAVVMFVLTGLVGGFMAFATAQMYLDDLSIGALLTYMPFIPADLTHPFHFFGYFFLITLFVNAVQIGWLWTANHHHAHLYQIATLILWPQHLNFLIVSAGVILLRTIPSEIVVIATFLLFWANIFASFFLTAYNMRSIYPTSPLYMASTYALFVLVVSTLIFWLVFGMDILAGWNLASSLSAY